MSIIDLVIKPVIQSVIQNVIGVGTSILKITAGWTGFQNCLKTSAFARFNGTDNYLVAPSYTQTTLRDEGTIVIWFIPVQLSSGNVKFYDIGNGVTASDFTTSMRIRFNGGVSTDNLRIVLADTAYNNVADVDGILEGVGAGQWRYGEPNMVYLSYYNDTVGGGPLTSKIQVGINGTLVFNDTFENAGGGDGTKQIAFNVGDNVVIGARHDLSSNFYNWDLGEVWSAPKFLEHGANMPLFMGPASTGFPNGTPVMRVTGGAVNGTMPSNHFGGFDYSISDWNNGNNGVGSIYTLNGPALLLGDGSTNKPFTVNFSKEASWIEHTDSNWYKNGDTAGEEIVVATSSTVSSAKQIIYDAPAFPTQQIAGDIVELRIGAASDYFAESDSNPISDFPFTSSLFGMAATVTTLNVDAAIKLIPATANFIKADGISTVEDFEGVIHQCKNGEARFWRARRVENLATSSEDILDSGWTAWGGLVRDSAKDVTIPSQGAALTVELIATAVNISLGVTVTATNANAKTARLNIFNITTGSSIPGFGNIDISNGLPIRIYAPTTGVGISIGDNLRLYIYVNNSAGETYPATASFEFMQIENTIAVLPIEEEYVSTGVLSTPWHGANVDGVKYFVTDRLGSTIADLRGCLVEEANVGYDQNTQGTEVKEELSIPWVTDIGQGFGVGINLNTYKLDNTVQAGYQLDLQGTVNNGMEMYTDGVTYLIRKTTPTGISTISVAEDFTQGQRLHNAVLRNNGYSYRIGSLSDSIINNDVIDITGGDFSLHIGTNEAGDTHYNASYKQVKVSSIKPMEAQNLILTNCLDPTLGVTGITVFGTGATVVSLNYVEPIDNTGLVYKLYRNNIYLTDLALGSTSYVDNSALTATSYTYRINTLFNGKIISATSAMATTQTIVVKTINNKSAISLVLSLDPGLHQTLIAPRNSAAIEFNTTRFN